MHRFFANINCHPLDIWIFISYRSYKLEHFVYCLLKDPVTLVDQISLGSRWRKEGSECCRIDIKSVDYLIRTFFFFGVCELCDSISTFGMDFSYTVVDCYLKQVKSKSCKCFTRWCPIQIVFVPSSNSLRPRFTNVIIVHWSRGKHQQATSFPSWARVTSHCYILQSSQPH